MASPIEDLFSVIDGARQIATDMGARPYRTFVRVRTWSGTVAGDGTPTDVDTELLPRPRVREQQSDDGVFSQTAHQAGLDTSARLHLSGISPLTAMATLNPPLLPNQQLYYLFATDNSGEIQPGLFVIAKGPWKRTTQWVLDLVKSEAT